MRINSTIFSGEIMKRLFTFMFLVLPVFIMYAQSTTIKLPTTDNTSSFNITKSDNTNLLRMFGDGGFYLGGTFGSGVIPISGSGTRMMWYPLKAAFRAGFIYGTEWDDPNIGSYSDAFGLGTIASGDASFASGEYTTASGRNSTALGSNSTASGLISLSSGFFTHSSGQYSTALGYETAATGQASTALGWITTASGDKSFAMGNNTIANGNNSAALGYYVSTNHMSGSFIIGDISTNTFTKCDSNNEMVMRFAGGYRLYTNSSANVGAVLYSGNNSWSTISDSTKKYAFLPINEKSVLNKIDKFKLRTWSYKGQDSTKYRHYGPMAQEFFKAFGQDRYGAIGNDTTISQADFMGINLVAIQALDKQLKIQKLKVKNLEDELEQQKIMYAAQQKELDNLKTEFAAFKQAMASFINKENRNVPAKLTMNNK